MFCWRSSHLGSQAQWRGLLSFKVGAYFMESCASPLTADIVDTQRNTLRDFFNGGSQPQATGGARFARPSARQSRGNDKAKRPLKAKPKLGTSVKFSEYGPQSPFGCGFSPKPRMIANTSSTLRRDASLDRSVHLVMPPSCQPIPPMQPAFTRPSASKMACGTAEEPFL